MSMRSHYERFEPVPESTRALRRAVSRTVDEWGLADINDQAVLGASELANNAILHTRDAFQLALRPTNNGLRIEIIDRRLDLIPIAVPTTGTAVSVTEQGTTGRGLQIVDAIADRWGYSTSQRFKCVWLELADGEAGDHAGPVVVEGYRARRDPSSLSFHLLDLPVRTAVASGVHVDELVRDVEMTSSNAVTAADRDVLYELLDETAPGRLAGRYAALDAAAQNKARFDMAVELSMETL